MKLAILKRWGKEQSGSPSGGADFFARALRAVVGIVAVGFISAAAASQPDSLHFESDKVEVDAGPGDDTVEVMFTFRNDREQPVEVISVLSNCGACLVAEATEGEIAPGASAEIRAVFRTGRFSGTANQHLNAVFRSGGETFRRVLNVAVTIPEVVVIDPPTIRWDISGELNEQHFTVRMALDEPIHLLQASVSREEFSLRIEEVEEGRLYRVHVTPSGEFPHPLLGLVSFETDCRYEKFRNAMGFLSVEHPRETN